MEQKSRIYIGVRVEITNVSWQYYIFFKYVIFKSKVDTFDFKLF